jgi:endonuclease/exonuclease/phosphatase family metal-dependent hydrolase
VIRRYGWLALVPLLLALAIWVLSVSKAGMQVEGCPQGCATAEGSGGDALRVMSLNVLHGYPGFERLSTRLALIADEIRRQDVDIVCLQEVPWTRRLGSGADVLSRLTGLNYLYLRANGNRRAILFEEGVAILSRYPLRDPTFVELEPRAGFFEHRVALHATAVTPWGDVDVFVTHLTNGDPEINREQAASLMAFVADGQAQVAVVTGDLNATEHSPQIRILDREWVDAYRAVHPDDPGLTCCVDDLARGSAEPLEKRIDYVFLAWPAGRGAKVTDARRVLNQPFRVSEGWQWASDHVGLLVTLEVGH